MSKWLNIQKQQPEDKQMVLFVVKDKVKYGCYKKLKSGKATYFVDFCAAKKTHTNIEYWQAIPEPPKVKECKEKKELPHKTATRSEAEARYQFNKRQRERF